MVIDGCKNAEMRRRLLRAPTAAGVAGKSPAATIASRLQILSRPLGNCPNDVEAQISNGVNAGARSDTPTHPQLAAHSRHA